LSPDVTSTTAVLILASSTTGASRRLWLRGLNDGDVQRGNATGIDIPSANLVTAMNAWIVTCSSSFVIRSLTPLGTPPNVYQQINSVTGVVGSGSATIGFIGVNPFLLGQSVIITQMSPKVFPGLNGKWTPTSGGVNTFTIPYNLDQAPPAGVAKGRWRPAIYQYGAIDGTISAFDHFGSRDTGAGFSAGRGRKRAVKLRSL
jgi:hypothetical protein